MLTHNYTPEQKKNWYFFANDISGSSSPDRLTPVNGSPVSDDPEYEKKQNERKRIRSTPVAGAVNQHKDKRRKFQEDANAEAQECTAHAQLDSTTEVSVVKEVIALDQMTRATTDNPELGVIDLVKDSGDTSARRDSEFPQIVEEN